MSAADILWKPEDCVLLLVDYQFEFQRDWTRKEHLRNARGIVVQNGGGYGMGLAYAREMIHS